LYIFLGASTPGALNAEEAERVRVRVRVRVNPKVLRKYTTSTHQAWVYPRVRGRHR